jgi:hypothetical protein
MSYRRISRRRVAYRRSSLSRQATRAVTVLGGMLSCVMVPPNGSAIFRRLLLATLRLTFNLVRLDLLTLADRISRVIAVLAVH